MIPALHKAFPDYTIVVRPHPTESQQVYHDIAAQCERVKVTNAGNVVPWLLAAKALIHNSCTTGVEAHIMRTPAITYRASINETYDFGFYRLPNLISHPCFNLEELETALKDILNGTFDPDAADDGNQRQQLVEQYLAAQAGPLACERMVDVISDMVAGRAELPRPWMGARLFGWSLWAVRTMIKRYKDSRPGSHNRPEFQRHRYPEITMEDMRERVSRFQKILNDRNDLKIEQIYDKFFRISP